MKYLFLLITLLFLSCNIPNKENVTVPKPDSNIDSKYSIPTIQPDTALIIINPDPIYNMAYVVLTVEGIQYRILTSSKGIIQLK